MLSTGTNLSIFAAALRYSQGTDSIPGGDIRLFIPCTCVVLRPHSPAAESPIRPALPMSLARRVFLSVMSVLCTLVSELFPLRGTTRISTDDILELANYNITPRLITSQRARRTTKLSLRLRKYQVTNLWKSEPSHRCIKLRSHAQ
ncbi:hypothetical protein BDW22DRAFT_1055928 [Trametopsis cervina]|nr:hypothetical protein BDW22DRAFT_1055928 [Trametopsis cervina]